MNIYNTIFYIAIIQYAISGYFYGIDSVITFFIKEKIEKKNTINTQKIEYISEKLQQPSFIHANEHDTSWLQQPGIEGLYASYLGYLAVSDHNGQITFPRIQQSDTIHILITPEVQPEFMIEPTLINDWITKHNSPTAFYQIIRKKHKKLKVYYFHITKIKTPQAIPRNTITIYADPATIIVPTGVLFNTYSTNFILPELQAIKVDTLKNSLYTLSIKQYFEQINKENKHDTQTTSSMVTNQ
ncbi:MAG: hypothetical protein ACXWL2_02940 [Candidatus Chromulinivorax sp.]